MTTTDSDVNAAKVTVLYRLADFFVALTVLAQEALVVLREERQRDKEQERGQGD